MPDVSAQGAAYLAGLKAGIYKDLTYLTSINSTKETVCPGERQKKAVVDYAGWQAAVKIVSTET